MIDWIKETLATARRVAATTDIWSGPLSTDSYLGVTVHFINAKTGKQHSIKISEEED